MIGGFGTALPGNLKQIPRVDSWIEVDEGGGSLSTLARFDMARSCLSKLLQLHDGLRLRGCILCCLVARWDDFLIRNTPAWGYKQDEEAGI